MLAPEVGQAVEESRTEAATEAEAAGRPLVFVSAPDRCSTDHAAQELELELEQLQYRERLLLTHWWPAAQRIYSEELRAVDAAAAEGAAAATGTEAEPLPRTSDVDPLVHDALCRVEARPGLTNAQKAEELWSFIEDNDAVLRSHGLHGAKHGQREPVTQ